jgi:hypothetical protein
MNEQVQQNYKLLLEAQAMRDQLLDMLSDDDLTFRLGGSTLGLGELFRQLGEVEHSYTQSFLTFTQDFYYRNPESGLDSSVARLRAWFHSLDSEMKSALENITGDETIQRGFPLNANTQIFVYREACLIFAAKVGVYLRALNKAMPTQVRDWVD